MRFICLLILILVLVAVIVFAVQNSDTVTLRFLGSSISTSMTVMVAAVYLLGMVSGWTVIGLLKRSLRRVTETRKE
jgi:lipopolysaccharide assembly protein A